MNTPALPTIPTKGSEDWFAYMAALDQIARTVGPALVPSVTTIPYQATVTPDASAGFIQRIALAGNLTIAPPANPAEAQMLMFELSAVGAGPWTVQLTTGPTGFKTPVNLGAIDPIPSGTMTRVGVQYRTSSARWEVLTIVPGY